MKRVACWAGWMMVAFVACGGEPGIDASESNFTEASSRTKALDPPVAVPTDNDIGANIADIVLRETAGAEIYDTREASGCTIDSYARAGRHHATHQVCADDDVIFWVWDGNEEDSRFSNFVWADHDFDGRVDGYEDRNEDGIHLADDAHDGKVDRHIVSVASLGDDFVIEGYGDGWIPPAYPAKRILEDTDHDGYFDSESVTGGRDPEGKLSWWSKP